jgi:hypothetical protein
MSHFDDVKSLSNEPKSFTFKWIFDTMNINNDEANVYSEKQKSLLNDINDDLDMKEAIRKIVSWRVLSFSLSYSIVDSATRFVISRNFLKSML